MKHNPTLGEYILLPQKMAPWGQNLYSSIWGRSWNYSGKSREEEKWEKEFPGTKASIYKGLETGEKKKKWKQKCRKVQEGWLTVSGWWWGWRARVLWPWEGFWTWVWRWKAFKQGNDDETVTLQRSSRCQCGQEESVWQKTNSSLKCSCLSETWHCLRWSW